MSILLISALEIRKPKAKKFECFKTAAKEAKTISLKVRPNSDKMVLK